MDQDSLQDSIAVLALAGRFPGAGDVEGFWRNLCEGVESISFLTPAELEAAGVDPALARNPAYVGAKAVLDGVELFDAAFFGFTPREAEHTDPQHRLLLECAWEALEAAGYGREEQPGPVGVFVGAGASGYFNLPGAPRDLEAAFGGLPDFLATRISYKLNLRGPSLAVQTACSTSLVAVHLAIRSLLDGECDMAMAGGVSIRLPQRSGHLYQEGGIYSPDGHCRAFDSRAGGTVGGNGAGIVLLKRLEDALADRDPIRAVIRGSAINNDGSGKVGYTAPGIEGQARVIAEALVLAGVDPGTVGYVEAHGTGTPLGDPIEVAALTRAFRTATEKKGFCALGSVKTNVGHLDTAAGVAGLIKAVLTVESGVLPPSLHFESPSARIDFAESPFQVNARLAPWPADLRPRRAGVSSFGMGGTNAHVVLEEPPAPLPTAPSTRPVQLLLLSARSEEALEAATARLAGHLRHHPNLDLEDVAFTLQTGRRRFEHRRMALCRDVDEAVSALESRSPARLPTRRRRTEDPPVVFLFTGQGAQHVGMGRQLYKTEAVFREQVDLACEILRRRAGIDPREILFPAPEEAEAAEARLRQTAWTQPALFVVEHALARLWMSWGVRPEALIGHSLGEYVAACLAGVFSLEEALTLVADRGALIQALPRGAMLAVPLPEEEVAELLEPGLSLAAVNSPKRCVVSGPEPAVASLQERLGARGVACGRLHTSHAFHSAMMEPVLDALAERVRAAQPRLPEIPFLSNVTGDWITPEEATDPAYWARHLRETVRFADGVQRLAEDPERVYLEIGPGRTLGSLVKQGLGRPPGGATVLASLSHPLDEGEDSEVLLEALGGLWLAGARIDWSAFHSGAPRHRVPLPTYPFERRPFWIGMATGAPAADSAVTPQIYSKEIPMADPLRAGFVASARQERARSLVQELFAELFGLSIQEVPPDLTFLELGADSLFLLRASQTIQQRFGVRVPFRRLLEDLATVDALAAYLSQEPGAAWEEQEPAVSAAVPAAREEPALRRAEPPPAPVLVRTPPAMAAPEAPASDLGWIVSEQLRLMREQIQALSGVTMTFPEPALRPMPPEPPESPESLEPAAPQAPSTTAVPVRQQEPLAAPPSPRPVFVPYQPLDRGTGGGLTPRQKAHLDGLVERICKRTRRSKELAQAWRRALANNRASAGFRLLWKELVYPLVGHRGAGSRIWDVDGNEYIDLTMGFGSLLFGHSPDFLRRALAEQVELGVQIGPESETAGRIAELICSLTGAERATFFNSGTEAVMTALRLARTVTGRPDIAVFAGSFHGTFDGVLAKGLRGADGTLRTAPLAPGVPQHLVDHVIMLDYDSFDCLDIVEAHAGKLAAVLVEPRQSRRPELETRELLSRLREVTRKHGIALVFDEVITGFRTHPGGIQALYGVQADITTYGKAVGNGLPIGVVAGKAVYLDAVDGGAWSFGDGSMPEADTTFIAGTFFKHPLVMAGVLAVLTEIQARSPRLQEELSARTARLAGTLNGLFEEEELPVRVVHFGSMFTFRFPPEWTWMDLFFYHLLEKGIYVWERRVCYLSTAHSEEDLERAVEAVRESVREMRQGGFLPERTAAPEPRTVPLTEGQRELWAIAQLGDDASVAYNLSTSLRLRGPLRVEPLRRALQTVVNRYEALRVSIDPLGEGQRIAHRLTIDLPLSELSAAAKPETLLEAEARRPFDLSKGPLLRARLIRLEDQLYVLVLTVHHIVADGRSLGLLLEEVGQLYAAGVGGPPAALPAPASFGDWVREQAAGGDSPDLEAAGIYWRERLAGPVPALELPPDRPRPAVQTWVGEWHVFSLGGDEAVALRRLAARLGCTSFVLFLAGVEVLLHRLSGQDDLVVGIPASGHPLDGGPLVGYCINMLPLRLGLAGDPTFAQVAGEARRMVLDAYEHQAYPFSRLLRDLGVSRDPGRPPLVSVLFNLDRLDGPGLVLPGLEVEVAGNPTRSAQLDLEWNVTESDRGFAVECFYDISLFAAGTIERWQGWLRRLLAAATANPERRVGDLELMSAEESQRLLVEWNRTDRGIPRDRCFHEIWAERARRSPGAVAAAWGGQEMTHGELDRRAEALAQALARRGVVPDSVVALLAPRGFGFLVAVLAIFKAGGAYLPLDPGQPARRHRQVLEQSGVRWLLAADELLPVAREAAEHGSEVLSLDSLGGEAGEEVPLPRPVPDQLAYVIYTSGSTGAPKGAMLTHRGMLNHLFAKVTDLGLDDRDTVAQTASQAFDISVWQLLAPLLVGGRVRIYGDDLVYAPVELLRRTDADGVTVLETVPSLLAALLTELEREREEDAPRLATLRWLLVTGETLPPELCARWSARHPEVPLLNAYGPTECSDDVTHHPVRQPPPLGQPRVPIGRPVANTRLYVVDRLLRPVPAGVRGELCVGGLGVGRGYLRDPRRTAEVFVPDPFSAAAGERLYRTGDLVRHRQEGELEFLGRLDQQVKIRGFRVEPGEIEAALGRHPGVRQAVVMAREDAPGERRLVAYVVPARQPAPAAEELRDHLAGHLPAAMVPAAFVLLDALPLTPNGKLDRRALPSPEPAGDRRGVPFVPPATPAEERLAAIWQHVLRVDRVGIHDDFFELGGDSILGIQVLARAREAGLRLTPRQIFERPTVAGLAAVAGVLAQAREDREPVTGTVPLTPIQRWFFEHDLTDPHHWNLALFHEVAAPVDLAALDRAVAACLAHHDALRLRFTRETGGAGGWLQRNAAPGGAAPSVCIDLSALPPPARPAALRSAVAWVQASLDLAHGPLARVAFFDLGSGVAGRLLLVAHHLATDIVSWQILEEDLEAAYTQAAAGREIALPAKTTSFREWAGRLEEHARSSPALRGELPYWLDEARRQAPRLPVDHPEGINREASVRVVVERLGADETRALLRDVPKAWRTQVSDALLTALAQAFSAWTGAPRLLVDLEGHGREALFEDVDLSRTMGWFTALYPVLLDTSGAQDDTAALQRVKEQLRAVPGGGIGYGLLRHLAADPAVTAALLDLPLAQVSFNYGGRSVGPREAGWLAPAAEDRGPVRSPRALRSHLLEIEGQVADGRLEMYWHYSEAVHRRSTIEALARGFSAALRRLIAASASPEAAGATPSDFPGARLGQNDLDRFFARLGRTAKETSV